jgi:hypothetical protein
MTGSMRAQPQLRLEKGVHMKKGTIVSGLAVLFLLFATTVALSQAKSAVSVKGSQLSNGVVVVDVLKEGKEYELQCNEGNPHCTALKAGKYQMVELPKNTGLYECRDVEIYSEGAVSGADKKIGEYCLLEK